MTNIDTLQAYKFQAYAKNKIQKKIQKLKDEYMTAPGGRKMIITKIIKGFKVDFK